MKQIEIEDDLYDFLLKRAERIGESATEIISRELRKNGTHSTKQPADPVGNYIPPQSTMASQSNAGEQSDVERFLNSPEFLRGRDKKDRFLAILSWAFKGHTKEFGEVVIEINQRGRVR